MALQIGRAFQDGIDELLSERGAMFAGVFIVYGLLSSVVWASLSQAFTELFLGRLPSDAQVNQAAMAGGTPLALDLPLAVAGVGALVLLILNEALNIVAIRAFASDDREPIPDNVGRRLGRTVVVAIAAGILTTIAVGIGLILLIIPGLVFGLLFFFVRQEIALNDSGVIESISNSVSVVTDNLLATFVLAIVLVVLGFVLGGAVSFLPISLPPMVLATVSTVFSSVVSVFSIAVTTVAYLQATGSSYTQDTESIGGL
ncbi:MULTISPECIES: hypothetical protein [Haloarcula]|jgi:hypothetical protein|uniref:DUF7847 domain-containing protein n=3 Tax=Haloarcula TaxID=2237 RepID=M0JWR7_9EURY|nr:MULTISPECIES: hypothetical protein [Haloarcula]AJF26187.1 hypothetical protein SG26_10840 [Haloarcula sp. CBA1115]EMA12848.1 hypothetical protein C436_13885 [Haloarcula sinaiiensis ATCC 33800]EMA17520.1 hypothetical protein C435_10209 [Haloarcula californiae ATCC 33799]KAA9408001.1 hypothetical protein Har1131_14685 [Haloarcula sp. CBA1131]MCJ0620985.1 hypothetical protein [Haloarcula hispanica]